MKNSNSPLNKSSSLHFIQPPEKFTDKHSQKHQKNGDHLYNDNHHYLNTGELVAYATEASRFDKNSSSSNLATYVQPPKQFAQQSTNHYLDHEINSKFNSSQRPNRRKVSDLNNLSCESKLKNNFSRSQDSILDDYLIQNQYEQPTNTNHQQLHKKKQKPKLSTFVQHPVQQQHSYPQMIASDYTTDDLYSSLEEPEPIYSYPSSSYINDNQPHSLQNNYLEQHYNDQIQPYSSFDPSINYHKSNVCSSVHNLNRKQDKIKQHSSFNQNIQPVKSINNRNSQSHHQLNYLHNSQKIYASNINYGNQQDYAVSSGHDSGYSMSTYQTIDRDRNLASKKTNNQNSSFYDPYSSLNQENQNLRGYSGMMKRSTSNTSDNYLDNLSTSCSSSKDLVSLPVVNYSSGLKNSLKAYSNVVDEFKLNKTSNLQTKSSISNLPMETVQRVKVQNSNDLYAQIDKTRKNSLKSSHNTSNNQNNHQTNKIQNLLEFYDQPSKLIKRADSLTNNSINHQVSNNKVNEQSSNNICKTTNSKMINHLTTEQLELYTEIEKKVKPIKNKLAIASSFDQSTTHNNESNTGASSFAATKAELRSQATFVKAKSNREKRATIAITLNENELDELNKFEGKPPSAKVAANQISKILQPIYENYKKMKLKPNKQTQTDQKQFNKFSSGKKMIIVERNLDTSKNLIDKSIGTTDKCNEEEVKENEELDKTIKRQDYDKPKTNDLINLEELKKLEDRFNEIRSTKDNTSTMTSTSSSASMKPRRPAPAPPLPKHKTSTLDLTSQIKKDFDTLRSTNSSGSNVETTATFDLNEKLPNKIDKNLNEKEKDLLSKSLNLPLNLDWTHDPLVLYKQTCHYLAFYLGTSKIKNLQNTQFSQKCIRDYRKLLIDNNLPSLTAVVLSISYKSVRCVDVHCQKIINEHEIKSIHYACQDLEHFRFFAYVTKDLEDKNNFNCHVFSAMNLELANEILTTLSQAFEIAFRVSNGETIDQLRKQYIKLKLNGSNRSNDRSNDNPPPPPRHSSYSLDRNLNISKSLSESQFNQLLISVSNGFSSNGRKTKKERADQHLKDDHPLKLKQLSASNSIKSIKSVKSESNYLNRRKSLQSNQSFTSQLTSLNNLIKPQKPLKPRPPLKHQTSLPESNISISNKLSILDQTPTTKLTRANLPINKPTVPEKPKLIKR